MNIKEIKALSDDELRVKVAELLGWTYINVDEPNSGYCPGQSMPGLCALPHYDSDLNWMHGAEETIKDDPAKVLKYYQNLCHIVTHNDKNENIFGVCLYWAVRHATARQLAEAFVLTMEE